MQQRDSILVGGVVAAPATESTTMNFEVVPTLLPNGEEGQSFRQPIHESQRTYRSGVLRRHFVNLREEYRDHLQLLDKMSKF